MVPRRKLINHGAAKLTRSGGAKAALPDAVRARSSTVPTAETPISNEPAARSRDAAHPTTPTTAASIANARLNGDEAMAAAKRANAEAIAMPNPACRQRRARGDGWIVVHGTSKLQIRLNTSVPFVPPKPNEFFIATSMRMSRAVLAQ